MEGRNEPSPGLAVEHPDWHSPKTGPGHDHVWDPLWHVSCWIPGLASGTSVARRGGSRGCWKGCSNLTDHVNSAALIAG